MGSKLVDSPKGDFMVQHRSNSSLVVDVKFKKHPHPIFMDLKESVLMKSIETFFPSGNGVIRYKCRLYVPNVDDFKRQISEEAHVLRILFSRKPQRCIMIYGYLFFK